MNVFVTGASGFLGSHVAEQLSTAGHHVRALVRRTSDTRFLSGLNNVELVEARLDDTASLERALSGCEYVIHAAGLVKARSEQEFFEVNAHATERLFEAATRVPGMRRFVLVSSLAVAGPSEQGAPVPLERTPAPVTAYGRSKLAGERAVLGKKSSLPLTIVRPPAIYGPRDREVLAFFRAIKLGVLPILGAPTNRMSMIYGPDCAAACVAALSRDLPSGTTLFVDDGDVHTFEELVTTSEAALGRRAFLRLPLPRRVIRAAALGSEFYGRVRNQAVMFNRDKCNELFAEWVCDGSATRQLLDWKPEFTFREGVQRTVDWYKAAGWL
ncbi:MAG TPA: NAD-dependent epimerase/dehydratase family protein [Polyangiaceae bacterium]|nr:NAD-dependent epimerase/dehydratase family protein [Polyangiaceae bacterium]